MDRTRPPLLHSLPLAMRLGAGFLVLICLALLAGVSGLYFMGESNRRVERISSGEVPSLEVLDDAKSATYRIRGDALEHILAARAQSETRLSGEIAQQEQRVYERLRQFGEHELEPAQQRLVARFTASFRRYMTRVREQILPLSATGRKAQAEALARGAAVKEFRDAREAINALMDHSLRRAQQRAENSRRDHRTGVWTVISLTAALTLLGAAFSTRLTRSLVQPLRRLTGYLVAIGGGNLDNRIVVDRGDEIGEMLSALDRTQDALRSALRERWAAEEALRTSERHFRTAFDEAPVGMAMVDADGTWTRVNEALCEMLGHGPRRLLGGTRRSLSHPEDADVEQRLVQRLLESGAEAVSGEKRFVFPDGRVLYAHVSLSRIHPGEGQLESSFLVHLQDITERRRAEAELERLAHFDHLTGLATRTRILGRLEGALARTATGTRHALLFVDLDRFKTINDSMGHQAGDELLRTVAERLLACVRPCDVVARFGGDEFTILLEDIVDERQPVDIAERVLESVRQPMRVAMRDVVVTASLGIAVSADGHRSPDDLIHDADVAMYRAKLDGRNRLRSFSTAQRDASLRRLDLVTDLRRGLDREELEVHYQPIASSVTGEVVGAEALVRWRHPEMGLLLPGRFLPAAQDFELMQPIGRVVLETACRQAASWHGLDLPAPAVNVNLSDQELRDPGVAQHVAALLDRTGLSGTELCLEVTEDVLMHTGDDLEATLTGLKELGVTLALDDFGTGHSSLARLKSLPIDVVKLDRRFVQSLGESAFDEELIAAVIRLSRSSGMTVVAEGVETAGQLQRLADMGCPLVQGFHLGRPMPHDAFTAFLAAAPASGVQRAASEG